MKTRSYPWTALFTLSLPLLVACKADDPETTNVTEDQTSGATEQTSEPTVAETGVTDDTGATDETGATDDTGPTTEPTTGTPLACDGVEVAPIDEGTCEPLASDYQPRDSMSANDMWAACVTDDGTYTQVEAGEPGSVARIAAYDAMAALLWDNAAAPTADDFTAAREQYVTAEGLESRLNRREDFHRDPIPPAEQDDQVDGDKQCTVAALVEKYPDRCVGPGRMKPIIDAAFVAGQKGEDTRVNAAKIHATLDWFLMLSVYKEAHTCGSVKAADCDSAWAYYIGVEPVTSSAGVSNEILAASKSTHERIHDGILAVRCWRDLYKDPMFPLFPDLEAAALDEFDLAWEQLDQSLHRGVAVLVRAHAKAYFDAVCEGSSDAQAAEWAYLQILGPALQLEADARNSSAAATLSALWASSAPSAQDVADGIAAIDTIFPCP